MKALLQEQAHGAGHVNGKCSMSYIWQRARFIFAVSIPQGIAQPTEAFDNGCRAGEYLAESGIGMLAW
jgi:hypothetical protein